ncbi:MAG: hypothetical protein ACTH0V_06500 [Microbacteriaceae bacterium]|uniref:hypothetical protein n=1 Tax=Microbacterium sp. TaxID=51671 RepID=UPI003F9988F9
MTRIAWSRYEGNDIEAVVAMLINREHPNSERITPSKGDGGVDILDRGAAADGGDVVYQVKKYWQPLDGTQKTNVEESLRRIREDPRWDTLQVSEWHLVTPWDPTPEADTWLQDIDDAPPYKRMWHGLTYVEGLAAKYPEVVDYYLEGGQARIQKAYDSVLALLAPELQGSPLDAPTVAERMSKAMGVLENDPHFRYELRLGRGELPGPVDRPDLVMTWVQSDGPGGRWQAVDVIALCAASLSERPIVVTGKFVAEAGSELAASIQDFADYGTPLATPPGAFEGTIDAPAGLGGQLMNASVTVLPSPRDDVGQDPDLILESISPGGEVIATTEVTRLDRSQGEKGIRIVLQQVNDVFSLEDRYAPGEGGNRVFRFGNYSNHPAADVHRALSFVTSASPPNIVRVRRKGAGSRTGSVDPNWKINFPSEILEVLEGVAKPVEALARLQEHTSTVLRVPDLSATTNAQAAEWARAAAILAGEDVWVRYPEDHALGLELGAEIESLPERFAIEVPLDVTVGGHHVSLGKAFMWIEGATLIEHREVNGKVIHWLTTPGRRVKYSLRGDLEEKSVSENDS